MATTENLHNGDGSKVDFPFTFPYLKTTDIKVAVDNVVKTITTHYTLHNATTIRFGSAPASGSSNVKIYRDTASENLAATFYPGSAIRSSDLNDNYTQNLYVTQEAENDSTTALSNSRVLESGSYVSAISKATTAITTSNSATVTADAADAKSDTAISDSAAAVVTAGNANTAAGNAVTAANTALPKAGGTMSGAIAMGTNKITGAGDPTSAQDLATKTYVDTVDATKLALAGGTMTGAIAMGTNKITGVGDPTGNQDAVTKAYLVANNYTKTQADSTFFNVSTGDTIKDGDAFPDNDTTIATTAAINDRIIDLVDDVGGFVPIANETSFPNANPDVNNGAGTLVSIKALTSSVTSNGSGVATISNGTVGNSTVTIEGLANSTTYAATYGMIVETTTTLNTYTFHRQTPKATEVTTVSSNISDINSVAGNATNINSVAGNATNINSVAGNSGNINAVAGQIVHAEDLGLITAALTTESGNNINTVATNINTINSFSDQYRVASSAPSSSLDEGDLWFDSTGNVLKVYNGSAWVVTASAGMSEVKDDTTPELGGHLDCNDKNLTEVGTVSGNNLQIDFGALV
tara:strand:+ start:686 stop:2428 length:1743 start_codon:yes stop_codon:yes gene_type:complete